MDTQPRQIVRCGVIARAILRADAATQATLRREPGPGIKLPNSFLRHADEQSLAALAVVGRAAEGMPTDFTTWGIVAGPRYLGRAGTAASLHSYHQEGAWGVSPHLIPHRSLHGVSGSISLALKSHGPNFGAGGGPGAAGDVLLAGVALLAEGGLPGVWVVATGWQPEAVPDRTGEVAPPSDCVALALALVRNSDAGWQLDVQPDADERGGRLEVEELIGACEAVASGTPWRRNVGGVLLQLRVGGQP
jgi:hypothetical protein